MFTGVGKCRRTLAISLRANQSLARSIPHGPDTFEELFDRHVAKKDKLLAADAEDDENELLTRQRVTSTRREALSLRATSFFVWPDSRGVLWRDVLRENERKEFEKDPEIVTMLFINGREAVQSALDKLVEKQKQEVAKEQANRRRGYDDRDGR